MSILKELRGLKKDHWPSYSRKLVNLAKKAAESEFEDIVRSARSIKEPYYKAVSLAQIAAEMGSERLFKESLEQLKDIGQEWRRGEALESISKKMVQSAYYELDGVLEVLNGLGMEKVRSDALKTVSKDMARSGLDVGELLDHAKSDLEKLDIIKTAAKQYRKTDKEKITTLADRIMLIEEPFNRAKAYCYMGFKVSKDYFGNAVSEVEKIQDEDARLEVLNYITDNMTRSNIYDLDNVLEVGKRLENAYLRTKFMAHAAGKLSRGNLKRGRQIFDDAIATANTIGSKREIVQALQIIAKGMEKAGITRYEEVLARAKEIADGIPGEEGEKLMSKLDNRKEKNETGALPTIVERNMVLTLGLYNTYDTSSISSSHIRAVARAAPLCWAFGLDLALLNFPFKDVESAVNTVAKDTRVGKGGLYLEQLQKAGRFHLLEDIGDHAIATTSHPKNSKKITMNDLKGMGSDLMFLLGVGRAGLPKTVLKRANFHLEFTGRDVPLETSTAMGMLAKIMHDILQ